MYLRPCRNCHKRTECVVYTAKLASLRGVSGITSAKFICPEFPKFYKPGDRVTVLMGKRFEACGDYEINATITHIKDNPKGKLIVLLDELPFEDSANKFMSFWPKHIKPSGESPVEVCGCGMPIGKESESTHRIIRCIDCVKRVKASQPQKQLPASQSVDGDGFDLDW